MAGCSAGLVFCQDDPVCATCASCKDGALCNTRNDVDRSCDIAGADVTAVGTTVYFGLGPAGFFVGPFDP